MSKSTAKERNDFEDEDMEMNIPIKPRIETLKEKARLLGIPFSPNIGEETLALRIQEYMDGKVTKETAEEIEDAAGLPVGLSVNELRLIAQKLTRVSITPNDPMKQQMRGEFVWTGNSRLPTFGKFVPFSTPRGYHVPEVILNALRDRTYTAFAFKKDQYGNDIPYSVQRKAYNIEVLPPLNQKQLEKIAARQEAQRRYDDLENDINEV